MEKNESQGRDGIKSPEIIYTLSDFHTHPIFINFLIFFTNTYVVLTFGPFI